MPPKQAKDAKSKKPTAASSSKPETKQKAKPGPVEKKVASAGKPGKKPKSTTSFTRLSTDPSAAIPIDVSFEGDSDMSMLSNAGGFAHHLKLEAPGPFTLLKTIVFPEDSEMAGYQAILVRPAKPFPFMKLTDEIRKQIYRLYFAPSNEVDAKIVLDGRRPSTKEVYAKSYSSGNKNRVAVLATSKQVNQEAATILYAHAFRFETTVSLLDFLSQMSVSVRPLLRTIELKAYSKSHARTALHFLAEARNLTKLRIENGMPTTDPADPMKAAKTFYADAYKLLEAIGAARGDKSAGVDILEFGEHAFTTGSDGKEPWDEEEVDEFLEKLRGRLK